MLKKKKIILIAAILSILLVAVIGGQAFAKYITHVKGQGIAEVATWSFKVNGQKEQVQNIQLISTCNNETLVNNKIAPGTSGDFNIIVDGTGSDVGIDYDIKFTNESSKPTNLKFIYDGIEYSNITDLENKLSGSILADDVNKEKTLNIKWKWDYETGEGSEEISNNDKIDTRDGENIANYTFDIVVSGTQMEPQV